MRLLTNCLSIYYKKKKNWNFCKTFECHGKSLPIWDEYKEYDKEMRI